MKKTNNQIKKAVVRNSKAPVAPVQTTKTTYRRITKNIYHDGYSYRTRVMVNGEMISRNFTSQKKAIAFRNELQRGR